MRKSDKIRYYMSLQQDVEEPVVDEIDTSNYIGDIKALEARRAAEAFQNAAMIDLLQDEQEEDLSWMPRRAR